MAQRARLFACTCREHDQARQKEYSGRGLLATDVRPSDTLGLSETLAAKLAIDALADYKGEHLPAPVCPRHKSDLENFAFRVFGTLDKLLFRGLLRGEVYLCWEDSLEPDIHGVTSKPGDYDTRIAIRLNNHMIKSYPHFTLPVLVHHMAHAYFLVCCGFREKAHDSQNHELWHGLAFNTLLYRISEVLKPDDSSKFSDELSLLMFAPYRLTRHFLTGRPISRRGVTKQTQGSNTCSLLDKPSVCRQSCQEHFETLKRMQVSQLVANEKANIQ